VRRRSMTNGNGGLQTQAPDLPLNGSGAPPQSGPLAVGPGQAGPGTSGDPGQGGLPVPLSQARRNGVVPAGNAASGGGRKGSPFSISNWRVRWRLVAIIAVPTITALILGVIQIVGSVNNYESFKRVQTLANLNALVVTATGQIADERDATVGFVASGRKNAALKTAAANAQNATTVTTNEIASDATAVINGSGYRAQTVIDLNGVLADISDLANIRQAATGTLTPALSVIQNYDLRLLQPFMAFSDDVAAGTGNATLQSDVTVLNALLHMEDDASLQRAYLYQALESSPPALTPTGLSDLNQAVAQQSADNSQFDAVAQVGEQQILNNVVSGQDVDEAESAQSLAIATADTSTLQIGAQQSCANVSAAQCWWTTKTAQIQDMRTVSNGPNGLVEQIQAQANSLAQSALRSAELVSVATLLLLLLVLLITTFVARSMIRPLRKLRADALEVAGSKLPEMVRRLSQSEGGDASAEIEPIGVNSTDEIGEVARAFDQVHREAVRLAADEAMLRGNLNAMFVNLSRRSQSLIERQLSLIDNLEQTEQDADRLSSLFRLDHLATRMRRNSENLLVLAGHEAASRRWSQPVPLVDVLRAAISEIEQYERVVLNVQPGIQVIGQAVNDVVHLVAEIVENATTFSSEDTQVYVTGQPLTSGGVLLDITDNGVGISEQEMAHANWRLDNPPVVDVAVSRRMGLFVVGRLAARHGVRVRLRHAQSGGLTALIWLPESVAAPESAQPLGRLRKFEADDYGPAPSLSAPTAVISPSPSSAFAGPGGAGPGGPGGPPAPSAPAGPGGLGSAAATAARIPRLGGGPGAGGPGAGGNGGGGNGAKGGFSAFGASGRANGEGNGNGGLGNAGNGVGGVGGGARPGASNGNGNGNSSTIEVPGGSLPVRTPGTNPLGPTGNGAGGGSMFGGGDGFGADEIGSSDFGTTRLPALGGDGGSATSGPAPIVVPPVGNGAAGSDGSQVTIPPAVGASQDHRLPIFDSLESDWFRRSGTASLGSSSAAAPAEPVAAGQTWSSPADEGYRAARVAAEPASDETTTAGLPKRTPRANLVPGSVGGGSGSEEAESAPPARSAETIRSRMASFQRGVRDARATASQNEEP
jgi:signal transduction histidine kinase